MTPPERVYRNIADLRRLWPGRILRILICCIWQTPFYFLTGWTLFDWQWWLMMVAIVWYAGLVSEFEKRWPSG